MDAIIIVDMQVGLLNGAPKYDLRGVLDRIDLLAAMVCGCYGKVVWISMYLRRDGASMRAGHDLPRPNV
ncbi:MAG: hypothetical protein ACREC6_11215 [Hyphomicrobiaceae bacterium]